MLGKHHRGGLQSLDVIVGIVARCLVLNGQNADHFATTEDRYGEERVIDLLTCLGAVGESRMRLGIRLIHGHRKLGAPANQALPALHEHVVHCFGVEPLGGEQLERMVLTLQIDGADLGNHQTRDESYDLVEPALTVVRLSHRLAEAAQDQPKRRPCRCQMRVVDWSLTHHQIEPACRTSSLVLHLGRSHLAAKTAVDQLVRAQPSRSGPGQSASRP